MNSEIVASDVAIQITEEKVLENSIKLKLDASILSSTTSECSIYRVQEKFRKLNRFAHTPEIVSIGPFHRKNDSLVAMEDHKLRYAHELLFQVTPVRTNKLGECIAFMKKIEDSARKCYSEPIELSSDEFVEMMVIDGLFIIELFRKNANGKIKTKRDDPIFGKIWGLASAVRDLVLLENQLPMVVLDCLFNVLALKEEFKGVSLNILALQFFNPLMPRGEDFIKSRFSDREGKHLLDLFRKTFHGSPPKVDKIKESSWKSIPSVTELKRAGVKFVVSSTNHSFLDIKFKDGVMEIPPIIIQDQTDTLLRTFIASEQCCDGHVTYMTSYAHFMDNLINSGQDVGVLRKEGIIKNLLGDDEDVSALFNKLCREVTLANFYYSDLCDQVNTYYNSRWHSWKATLRRDYFNSPWAIISFVGAVILLVLTFLATLYAMLAYTKQSKPKS